MVETVTICAMLALSPSGTFFCHINTTRAAPKLDGYEFMMYNVPWKWGMVPERRHDDAVSVGRTAVLVVVRHSPVREDRGTGERRHLVERARGTSLRIRRSLGGDPPPALPPTCEEGREGTTSSRRRRRLTGDVQRRR